MKALNLIIICLLIISNELKAQDESFKTFGGTKSDHGNGVVVDDDGNTYVTGSFQGTAVFGEHTLHSEGDTDIFLQKVDKSGGVVWAVKAGSSFVTSRVITEAGYGLVLLNKFLYITGTFSGKALFGSTTILSRGKDDIFLAKYSTDGNLIWVKSAGGRGQDIPFGIATDGNAIYITGQAQKDFNFDNVSLTAAGSSAFVAKYSTEGDLVWANNEQGSATSSIGKAIACNDAYCVMFGNTINEFTSTPFFRLFNLNGDNVLTRQLTNLGNFLIQDVALLGENFVVAGKSAEGDLHQNLSLSTIDFNAAVARVNHAGEILWINRFGGDQMDVAASVSVSDENQILVGGNFQKSFTFQNYIFESAGGEDIFLASFDEAGKLQYAKTHGGTGQDKLNDVYVKEGSVYMAGFYRGSVSFNGVSTNAVGQSDVFISSTSYSAEQGFNGEGSPIKLYPMPAKDHVILDGAWKIDALEVKDHFGKEVFKSTQPCDAPCYLNVEKIPSGVYLVNALINGESHQMKLLIVH
jgi:hypothetical protein